MAKQLRQLNLWDPSKLVADGVGSGQSEQKPQKPGQSKTSPESADSPRMARGRMLAADPNYPTEEILEALSEMLARHWYS